MPTVNARRLLVLLLALSLLSFAWACSKDDDDAEDEDNANATETAAAPYKPTGNEGSVTGSVAFTGAAPAARPISMDADPACASSNPNAQAEDVVVHDGKLQNVFVYVKEGKTSPDNKSIAALTFDAPAPEAVLDQRGCQYHPHVLGLMTTQNLRVTNSDQTTHNVHPSPKSNQEWNQSQPSGAPPIVQKFTRPETLVPVKCNQHPWMKSYVGVLRHPFFAVSGPDGRFEIKGLPPGTYTLVAWHEKFGEKSQSVTVGAKESKTQDFSFDEKAASNELRGGSLAVMPALELPVPVHH